jgi:four helix bundle protein
MFKFEGLEIWKESIKFTSDVYGLTKTFPAEERFGLTQQLRNAATSISLNIAEGSGRFHNRDFLRFLQIAIGSLYEVVSGLCIAKNQDYIGDEDFKNTYSEAEKIAKMINAFISYLKRTDKKSKKPMTIGD